MAVFLTGRMLQALSYDIIQKCHENCKFSFSMLQLSVTFLGVGIEGCRRWGCPSLPTSLSPLWQSDSACGGNPLYR